MSAMKGTDSESQTRSGSSGRVDVVVVGAGFAGLYMLYRLREQGLSVRVFEAGNGIGGTWFWNRYPGARCDIESLEYSYQFSAELQQEWNWSERYATQPEILRYIDHVADRFDLRSHIQLNTRVNRAVFAEDSATWQISTSDGGQWSAGFCVMATGCLSSANLPDIPGRDTFRGQAYHTGQWPQQGVDFTGLNVGVIGTGSSAIQSIPLIAAQAKRLTVFQRSPNYSIPAHNQPLDPERVAEIKSRYPEFRAANRQTVFGADFGYNEANAVEVSEDELQAEYERRWAAGGLPFLAAFADLILDEKANRTAADFIRGKIAEAVNDPDTARRLTPESVVGCKRLCVDTNYYQTFNRPNVRLVDLREDPILSITPQGVRLGTGEVALDAIVFATGFDAMTGAIEKIDIRGRGGRTLKEKWSAGPLTYLGLMTSGFPNLFTITGPGSPSVLTNMLPSIEQHVEFVAECIGAVLKAQRRTIDPTPEAESEWVAHVNEVAHSTLYPNCNSWYLGANVPGKPRVFMPYLGFSAYVEKCEAVVEAGYEGFVLEA